VPDPGAHSEGVSAKRTRGDGEVPRSAEGQAERQRIPIRQFNHKEWKGSVANDFPGGAACGIRSSSSGVVRKKAKAFHGAKVNGHFQFHSRQDGLPQSLRLFLY